MSGWRSVHFASGVDKVLVVDVEDRDDSAYREVTPIHGGVSGWRMLWDRLCPFERLR
jgi:lysophospholipid hydrolase